MSTHRISVDIPEDEHKYLKMCCIKLGVSMKEFVLKAVIEKVEDQEDEWWIAKPENQELLRKSSEGKLKTIPFEEVMKELNLEI